MSSNKKSVKIAVIGTNGVPAKYGGFETLVEYLTQYLGHEHNLIVYCSKTPKNKRLSEYKGAKLVYLPFKANMASSIIYDYASIIHAWFNYDILLILGCSGATILPLRYLFKKRKIIMNLGGLDWQRSKWNFIAKKVLKVSEAFAIKFSDVIISDNAGIADYIKDTYKRDSSIIEYGGDQAFRVEFQGENKHGNYYEKYSFLKGPYYLAVSRIQPDNNLEMMIDAFTTQPEKTFVLVSNWDFSSYGNEVKEKYKGFKNIILIGPIYDQYELNLIRSNCYAYIHGHSAGGTNPALVEAMHLQIPVLAYGVSFNRATTEDKALYFNNSDELSEIVCKASKAELESNAHNMKEIADRRYIWSDICAKYGVLFYQ